MIRNRESVFTRPRKLEEPMVRDWSLDAPTTSKEVNVLKVLFLISIVFTFPSMESSDNEKQSSEGQSDNPNALNTWILTLSSRRDSTPEKLPDPILTEFNAFRLLRSKEWILGNELELIERD